MTEKLPKSLIDELDGLMKRMLHGNTEERGEALARLTSYERAGRIPLSLLMDMAGEADPGVAMYAASALGRNGGPEAVKKLAALVAQHREGNPLFLETLVDALGETRSFEATPALLELIRAGNSWTSRLKERFTRKSEEQREREEKLREQMVLPVTRAFEKIGDPRAAEAIEPFLDHADPLVRCHVIRTLINARFTRSLDRLRDLAGRDPNPLVQQLAQLAVERLSPLPAHMNN